MSYLVFLDEIRDKKSFSEIFGRDGELELEIGPGYDPFIIKRAKKFPDRNFFAIEIDGGRVRYILNLLKRNEVKNVRLLWGDAKFLVPNIFVPDTFLNIFVLFPDPWPKKRQSKNRLLNFNFLIELFYILKVGGHLTIATDHREYGKAVFSLLNKIGGIKIFENVENYKELPHITKFEEIFLKRGDRIFVFKCVKTDKFNEIHKSFAEEIFEREKVLFLGDFKEKIFDIQVDMKILFDEFKVKEIKRDDGKIFKYTNLYLSENWNSLILEGVCKEKRLTQNLYFKINKLEGKRLSIAPFTNKKFLYTKGVEEFLETFYKLFFLDFKG